jgi:hypothetical protein
MKAERLHGVILQLRKEISDCLVIDRMQACVNCLQAVVDRPNEPALFQGFTTARDSLLDGLKTALSDAFDPSSRQVLFEIGGSGLAGGGLKQTVESALTGKPASALTELKHVLQRMREFVDSLEQSASGFRGLGVRVERPGPTGIDAATASEHEGLLASTVKLLPLYGIYLFLSGWASLNYYYRFFGMDPKSLDIGLYDTVLRGFTILFQVPHFSPRWLFLGPGRLWFVYVAVIVISILSEWVPSLTKSLMARVIAVSILLFLLPVVYFISSQAGIDRAKLDKSGESTLPAIVFEIRDSGSAQKSQKATSNADKAEPTSYHGKLLLLRNGIYFVEGVAPTGQQPVGNLQVSLYRLEDLRNVSVVEHQ